MAIRRMFSREVVDTDAFLDMPATSQRLYFFLGIFADDEGFLKNPRSVIRQIGGSNDDLNMLIFKGFVIPFDSGVIVITHWKMNNYIQKDRFKPTTCVQEKAMLLIDKQGAYVKKDNGYGLDTPCIQTAYSLDTPKKSERIDDNHSVDTPCIQPVYNPDTQGRLVKIREEEEDGARAREAAPPAPPATEMQSRINDHQHAEQLIRRYGLPDNDLTIEAVLEDAEAHGWERLEAALQKAALSNSRQRISVVFYRSILTSASKEGTRVRADPYANYPVF